MTKHDELVTLLTEIRDRLPIDDATNARYEREDAEAREDDPDESDAFYWMRQAEKEKARAERADRERDQAYRFRDAMRDARDEEKARAERADRERDEARQAWDEWKESSRAAHAHATDMARLAEEWRAKYAALRADVEDARRNPETLTRLLMRLADVIDRDDERAKGEQR